MNKIKNPALLIGVLAATGLALAGCGSKATQSRQDAPRVGANISTPAELHNMPDGFSNYAEDCDGHGHRIVVLFHNDSPYGGVAMIADPTCPGYTPESVKTAGAVPTTAGG